MRLWPPAGPLLERVTEPHTLEDRTRRRRCLSGPSPPPLQRGDGGPTHKPCLRVRNDARTGMPPGIPEGAMCVQRFDDSRNSAIHITYRISLRSSSMPEPRDPLLKVLNDCISSLRQSSHSQQAFTVSASGGHAPRQNRAPGRPPRRRPEEWARQSNTRCGRHGWEIGTRWGFPHSVMILPQVHLRKPCYDFYFL